MPGEGKSSPPNPGPSSFSIFGDDESIIVNASSYPNRCIAKLYISFPNLSKERQGTAFLYDDNKLATAAHCLYDGRFGGKATKIRVVFPGKSYTVSGSSLYYPSRWTDGADNSTAGNWVYDYGVIKLSSNAGLGYFGLSTSVSAGTYATVAGYRSGKSSLNSHKDTILQVGTYDISYRMDTMSGQSGGPVFVNKSDGPYVVGINNYHAAYGEEVPEKEQAGQYNTAARLNGARFDYLMSIK